MSNNQIVETVSKVLKRTSNVDTHNLPSLVNENCETLASMETWINYLSRRSVPRLSDYGQILYHRRLLKMVYGGLSTTEIIGLAKEADKCHGNWCRNFVSLLERRLDITLWRANWVISPGEARSLIRQGKVMVNQKVNTKSNLRLNPGDVVAFKPNYKFKAQSHCRELWEAQVKNKFKLTSSPLSQKSKTEHILFDILNRALCHGTITSTSHMLGIVEHYTHSDNKINTVSSSALAFNVFSKLIKNETMTRNLWTLLNMECSFQEEMSMNNHFIHPPQHLEVNFSIIKLIYLYTPERILMPSLIDFERLKRDLI